MKNFKRLLSLMPLFLLSPLMAQENNPTAGLWQELEVSKSLPLDWKVGVNADLRTMDFFKHINRYSVGVDVSKGVGKYLKFGFHYSFLRKHFIEETEIDYKNLDPTKFNGYNVDADNYANRHRISFDVTADKRFWKTLRISLRERYQFTYQEARSYERTKYRDPIYNSQGEITGFEEITAVQRDRPEKYRHLLRSRLKFAIDKKGWIWEPFTSVEFHNDLQKKFHLDKLRVTAGAEFKVAKWCNLSVAYLYNHEKDEDSNLDTHALCFGYNFKF